MQQTIWKTADRQQNAHVHPQRKWLHLCPGLDGNQYYDVCVARVNVNEPQWRITKIS